MSIGKVGISLKRKVSDDSYGNREVAFWVEEEYQDDADKDKIIQKNLEDFKARMKLIFGGS